MQGWVWGVSKVSAGLIGREPGGAEKSVQASSAGEVDLQMSVGQVTLLASYVELVQAMSVPTGILVSRLQDGEGNGTCLLFILGEVSQRFLPLQHMP